MTEMGKMSETMSTSMRDGMKTLNERMNAMVEKFKAIR